MVHKCCTLRNGLIFKEMYSVMYVVLYKGVSEPGGPRGETGGHSVRFDSYSSHITYWFTVWLNFLESTFSWLILLQLPNWNLSIKSIHTLIKNQRKKNEELVGGSTENLNAFNIILNIF